MDVGEKGCVADFAARIELLDEGVSVAGREVVEMADPGDNVGFFLEVVMIGNRGSCCLNAC